MTLWTIRDRCLLRVFVPDKFQYIILLKIEKLSRGENPKQLKENIVNCDKEMIVTHYNETQFLI